MVLTYDGRYSELLLKNTEENEITEDMLLYFVKELLSIGFPERKVKF